MEPGDTLLFRRRAGSSSNWPTAEDKPGAEVANSTAKILFSPRGRLDPARIVAGDAVRMCGGMRHGMVATL